GRWAATRAPGPARPVPAPAARGRDRGSRRPSRSRDSRPRGRSPLLAQLLDLLPRPRVEDLLLREPCAARLPYAELDVVERLRLVPVRVDREQDAGLGDCARVDVAEVEAVRLRVDLQERLRRQGALDDRVEVELDRAAPADLPSGRMADAVDERVVHRGEDALRRDLLAGGVDGRDDPIAA